MPKTIAFMPLSTYPEAVADAALLNALHVGAAFGCGVQVTAYAADIPQLYSPMGDVAFDISALIEGAQKASAQEARRLESLIKSAASAPNFTYRAHSGGMFQSIPQEARLYNLALLPWQKDAATLRDIAEALIFGAGRPLVMVPEAAKAAALTHLAVAWNGSAVAARALNDALPLLAKGGRVTVLTASGEAGETKADHLADALVSALKTRGFDASAQGVATHGKTMGTVLQDAAITAGAQLLAMGGYGHSRLRDFVLGGATKGVLMQLNLPVLLSH